MTAERTSGMYDVDEVVVDEAIDVKRQLAGIRTAA
jgi:hypothetical protein